VFFTRLPPPPGVLFGPRLLDHASRWFPWVGAVLGLLFATGTVAAGLVLPVALVALVPVVGSLLLTGAFHEDGLADLFDGFGGGWTRDDVLRIMKDSRLGTYGTAALVVSLLVRWQAWVALLDADVDVWLALPLVHAWSRFWALSTLWTLPYAREDGGRVKPLATSFGATASLVAVVPVAALTVVGSLPVVGVVVGLVAAVVLRLVLVRWFRSRIDGWTGDAIGGAQQLQEALVLLVWVAVV
jgi:adenosylcobinamide-GDP ribazoletransferase